MTIVLLEGVGEIINILRKVTVVELQIVKFITTIVNTTATITIIMPISIIYIIPIIHNPHNSNHSLQMHLQMLCFQIP